MENAGLNPFLQGAQVFSALTMKKTTVTALKRAALMAIYGTGRSAEHCDQAKAAGEMVGAYEALTPAFAASLRANPCHY